MKSIFLETYLHNCMVSLYRKGVGKYAAWCACVCVMCMDGICRFPLT